MKNSKGRAKHKGKSLIKRLTIIFLCAVFLLSLTLVIIKYIYNRIPMQMGQVTWYEYTPKCKALADNVQIFIPSNWNVSDDFPIYDGPYNIPPKSKADRDFNNLVSQCQILIGFGVKPESYQDSHEGNYGIIEIRSQNVEVPPNLNVIQSALEKDGYYPKNSKIYYWPNAQSYNTQKINGQTFLINKKNLFWTTISSHGYMIDVSLDFSHPDYNSLRLNKYMGGIVEEIVEKLVVK